MRSSRTILVPLVLFVFQITQLTAQPGIQWERSYGGSENEFLNDLILTSDGGYIMVGLGHSEDGQVGSTDSFNNNYWVLKTDNLGNIEWSKALGGGGADWGECVIETSDGGFLIGGTSDSSDGDVSSNHGGVDIWIVKLDVNGNIQWDNSLGGSDDDRINSIQQTTDGGYILAGVTRSSDGNVSGNQGISDAWIVKLYSNGLIEWERSFGGSGIDAAECIRETADGGYIFAGETASNDGDVSGNHGGMDVWLVKLDNTGNIQWQKCLGGSDWEWSSSIELTSDGGYVIGGYSQSSDGDLSENASSVDYWIVKLDGSGIIQ